MQKSTDLFEIFRNEFFHWGKKKRKKENTKKKEETENLTAAEVAQCSASFCHDGHALARKNVLFFFYYFSFLLCFTG